MMRDLDFSIWAPQPTPVCEGCPLRGTLEEGRTVGMEYVGDPPYEVIFIGEAPGNEELVQGRPFVGPAGKLLRKVISESGLEGGYIIGNAVLCAPHPDGAPVQTPTPEVAKRCVRHVLLNLKSENPPKKVILLGRTAIEAVMSHLDPDFRPLDRVSQYIRKYSDFVHGRSHIYPANHPSFVIRRGGESSDAYSDFRSQILSAINSSVVELPEELAKDRPVSIKSLLASGELPAKPKGKLNYYVFSLSDYEKGFELIEGLDEVSFDVETSGSTEVSVHRTVIFVGLGNHEIQVGFDLRKDQTKDRVLGFFLKLHDYLKTRKRVIVFNQSYEAGVLFQIYNKIFQFYDVFSMVKAVGMPRGLKDSASTVFGIEPWSDAVEAYTSLAESMSKAPEEWATYLNISPDLVRPRIRENIESALKNFPFDLDEIKAILSTISLHGFHGASWSLIPPATLARYNAMDVRWTHELYLFLHPLYPEEVWQVYQKQEALGSVMHLFGIAYDKERAKLLKKEMMDIARNSLANLVMVPKMRSRILQKALEETKIKDVPELKELFSGLYRRVSRELKEVHVSGYEEVLEKRKKEYQNFMSGSIVSPPPEPVEFYRYFSERRERVLDLVYKRLEEQFEEDLRKALSGEATEESLDTISRWFNPSSSKRYFPVFHKAIYHPKLAIAALLDKVVRSSTEDLIKFLVESFGPMTEWVSRWTEVLKLIFPDETEQSLLAIAERNWQSLSDGLKDEYIESLFRIFSTFFGETLENYPECLALYDDDLAQSLKMLVEFRIYKKAIKVIDAFLSGKMGEGLVYPASERLYREIPVPVEDREEGKKDYYRTEFLVNFADTRRWTSRFHTIPTGTEVRECYVSRWGEDGLWLHFDYSQMELRALAAVSGDENMMKAFLEGADIHRYVASRIYGIPMEQVSSHQRRNAKGASFSLVYGQTAQGLAMQYLNGNVAEAERIFDSFFKEFPKVKDYIALSHAYAGKHGHVKTLFGDYLDIGREKTDWQRRAQNYPIQSVSSSVAALSGWAIWEEIERRGLMAVPVAFTHDALDFDVYVPHLLETLEVVSRLSREVPRSFGIPADIEISLGYSLYGGLVVEFHRTEDGDFLLEVEGEKRVFDVLLDRLKRYYTLEVNILSQSTKKIPLSEIFQPKRALSVSLGKEIEEVKAEIIIRLP